MKTEKIIKESFCVIGKEGSTADGTGFVERLWAEANSILQRRPTWRKKTKPEIMWAFGVL